jgi:hypothetical protein
MTNKEIKKRYKEAGGEYTRVYSEYKPMTMMDYVYATIFVVGLITLLSILILN